MFVTPFAGVWIEMQTPFLNDYSLRRHSLRGSVDWNFCGRLRNATAHPVTPFAGVWIEIAITLKSSSLFSCHSLRGSVDWNLLIKYSALADACHSLRGSVDWNTWNIPFLERKESHSLRGSVDWNLPFSVLFCFSCVTPFAGVWIEMHGDLMKKHCHQLSLPSRECGLKSTSSGMMSSVLSVTPFAGVWIEITALPTVGQPLVVTPFAGVWIEIN